MGIMKLEDALNQIQKITTEKYAKLVENIDKNPEDTKQQVISYIEKIIKEKEIKVIEYDNDNEELAKRIYKEMAGFSILDEFFDEKEIINIEEINILSWKDIIIYYNNGKRERSKHHFFSPEHSVDIVKRLLSKNGMTMNKAKPIVVGYLRYNGFNIRITAFGEGIIDENLGIGASIRIVNPRKLKKENFLANGLCNDEMLDFLSFAYSSGISMCITGETGSGKTTLMSYIMEQIPPTKRLITMEENTREYNLHTYDENGYMTNNVVHLITRESEIESENITLSYLLKTALTSDPNYMCVSEMKGDESVQAVASANTGHAVISTTHSKSCEDTYDRILFLSKQSLKNDISTEILLRMIIRAFPIVVNIQYFADNVRRIAEITECLGVDEHNQLKINRLYEYNVEKNEEIENGEFIVSGYFKKNNEPSQTIKKLFLRHGATEKIINKFFSKKGGMYANS